MFARLLTTSIKVPVLTERDWSLMLAKAEIQTFKAGQTILEVGATFTHVYRIRRGSVRVAHVFGSPTILIAGDWFGERLFLGRSAVVDRLVAVEDTELWALLPARLSLIWSLEARVAAAFMGHVAVTYASTLRAQSFAGQLLANTQNGGVSKLEHKLASQRSTMALGSTNSAALREQLRRMAEAEGQSERLHHALREDADTNEVPAKLTEDVAPVEQEVEEAYILQRECKLGKRAGILTVTTNELVFRAPTVFGGLKTVLIPFDAVERVSTIVPDDVIRGRRHASKVFSKSEVYTITLQVRKRARKSIKQVERVLGLYNEAEAAEVFTCVARLVQSSAEDRLTFPRKVNNNNDARFTDSDVVGANGERCVARAVALLDYSCDGFAFHVGDTLLLTGEKKDLRVRGRLESDPHTAALHWFPTHYVEHIVWVHNVRGLPQQEELGPILAVGQARTYAADETIIRQGDPGEAVYFVVSGVCRVTCNGVAMGKLAHGDVFGDISFLLGGTCSALVVAHTNVKVVVLKREVLRATFAMRIDLATKFYKYFAAVNLRRLERNASMPITGSQKRLSFMHSVTSKLNPDTTPKLRDSAALQMQLERNASQMVQRGRLSLEGERVGSVTLNALI
jgi:CRP-like cAMP-binding protein